MYQYCSFMLPNLAGSLDICALQIIHLLNTDSYRLYIYIYTGQLY